MSNGAVVLDGRQLSKDLREKLKSWPDRCKVTPHLVIIEVGGRDDSAVYIRMKTKACADVGFKGTIVNLKSDCTQAELLKCIKKYNQDPGIHGILVQMPLPDGINAQLVMDSIADSKDVDGFSTSSVGRLTLSHKENILSSLHSACEHSDADLSKALMAPCTAIGVIEILDFYARTRLSLRGVVELVQGKKVVVIGRSSIVGFPTFIMLSKLNASCTLLNSHSTEDSIKEELSDADVVVVAIGKAEYIKGSWLKEGSVVIDVGINMVGESVTGKRLLKGDVEYAAAIERVGAITPVPGGVGPMTVTVLLQNTLQCAIRLSNESTNE